MTEISVPLETSPESNPSTTGRYWRAPVLLLMALSQSACVATVIGTGMADPFYDAIDSKAQQQVEEQYRLKYPGVDINDEYELQRAIFEEAKRENPDQLRDLKFPSRPAWEANNAKSSNGAAASAGRSSAATSASTASPNQSAQDQALLKNRSTPWVVVSKTWPYDALNFSSVAPYTCGFSRLQYSVNGGEMTSQAFTPCLASAPAPNPPYLTFPQGSIETVKITMTFADGSRQTRNFQRDDIFQR